MNILKGYRITDVRCWLPAAAWLIGALVLGSSRPAHAATKRWTGDSTSGNWSVAVNWNPPGAPMNGDQLAFVVPATDLLTTNDLTDLRAHSILFDGATGGFFLRGNAVTVSNGITAMHAAGVNTVALGLTNGAAQTTRVSVATATLDLTGDIDLNGFDLTFTNAGTCNASRVIRGTGNLSKIGAGTLGFGGVGPNTYVGNTTVNGGTLRLGKGTVSLPGNLFVGDGTRTGMVLVASSQQIADTAHVTLRPGCVLDLDGNVDTISNLTLQAAQVITGGGALDMEGSITNLAAAQSSYIESMTLGANTLNIGVADGSAAPDLRLGSIISFGAANPGLTINGEGQVFMLGNSTYRGTTTINNADVLVINDTAFGNTNGGVVINSGSLHLEGAEIGNETLTINGPGVVLISSFDSGWSGPVILNEDVIIRNTNVLTFSNRISGPGGITFTLGEGICRFAGTVNNDYTGPTVLLDGGLYLLKTAGAVAIAAGSLQIGDGSATNEVRELQNNQIASTVPITLYTNGTLTLNNVNDDVGALTFNGGTVTMGTGTLTPGDITVNATTTLDGRLTLTGTRTWNINGPSSYALIVNANVGGSGSLIKTGFRGLRLNSANTFSGSLTINAGEVAIYTNTALGTTSGGTILNSNATLALHSVAVGGEPLSLGEQARLDISGDSSWAGNITLNNSSGSFIRHWSDFTHTGVISGLGHLHVASMAPSTMVLGGSAANTYSGNTFVDGPLELNKSAGFAIPNGGTLTIGGASVSSPDSDAVRTLGANQIPAIPIVINASGLLDLNGFDTTVGLLTLNGGHITTGAGTLSLASNVIVGGSSLGSTEARISGRLNLGTSSMRRITVDGDIGETGRLRIDATVMGAGGILKDGLDDMILSSSNSYSGITIIARGGIIVTHPFALGPTNSGTIVSNSTGVSPSLTIATQGGLEPITLRGGSLESTGGSNSWAADIVLARDSRMQVSANTFLNLSGAISGQGRLEITGGTLIFSGGTANTCSNIFVAEGTLLLEKTIGNAASAFVAIWDISGRGSRPGTVRLTGVEQLGNRSKVNILGGGSLELNGVSETLGSISGSGQIDLGNGGHLRAGNDADSSVFSGVIDGTGQVTKIGTGTWTLSGTNTYAGLTTVENGALIVNGFQPQSPVTVNAIAALGGTGVVGNITAAGTLAPGSSTGPLTCSNLVFTSAGDLNIELGGDAFATAHDQLVVRGTNHLGAATLNLIVGSDFAPVLNQNLDLIVNDGSDATTGTFAGLPADSVFTAGDYQFRVSYASGAGGNDVRLTVVSNALRLLTVQNLGGGNRNGTFDPNECNTLGLFPITNVSAAPVTGVSAILVPRTPGLAITQPFSAYPDVPVGGRVNNLTPFQISALPGFQCGTNVRFDLVVQTASHGNYRFPFAGGLDDSGELGPLVRFDNNAASAIPDLGTLNSTISVTGVTTAIRQVVVSLHITHTALEDLDISLISPGGVIVDLTSDNGGTGSDYGTGCADAQRTRFEAGAVSLIATSAPSFVGVFAPEGSLGAFNGDVGSDVNGDWTLRVVDDSGGGVGTLRCWSLFIASAFCPPGSGPCESCPERTIYGYLNQGSPTISRRLQTNAQPSICLVSNACPTASPIGPYHFDAYTFVNGESNACITVALDAGDCDLFSFAYSNRFNPAALCANFLGDLGRGTATGGTGYSFSVDAGARFVVVVTEVVTNSGCQYTLTVSGGSCRPVLDVEPVDANRVAFDWSTAAVGYSLERTNNLGQPSAPAWSPAPSSAVITDSRFRLTNTVTGSRNFYRLRKP